MILSGREVEGDLRRGADAVVVGTGAGGAMMLRELAAAGLDVVGLEMGPHVPPREFTLREDEMLELLYQDGGGRATADLQVRVLQGRGVGGSTVHNLNLCKRTPAQVLEEWAERHGVTGALPADLEPAFRAVEEELSIATIPPERLNRNNALFRAGCEALGYAGGPLAHNRVGCQGSGFCELGCPFDAKENAQKVLVPRAVRDGATVYADARVDRVLTRRGRAAGVRGTFLGADGRPRASFQVEARVVVLAGSATGSAALHLASGLPDPSNQAGRNLRLHPGAVVAGVFDEEVRGWEGIPQAWECTELLSFAPGSERRVWLIPAFAHPIGTAVMIPGFGPEHAALMRDYPRVAAVTAMVHDTTAGRVSVGLTGRLKIRYDLNPADRDQLLLGLREGARILLAAGARYVLVPYESDPLRIDDPADLDRIAARGLPPHDLPLTAVHPMGTLRMGDDPRRSVVASTGEHHAVPGLFVADGALFPTSIGVPPQVSIYAFARHLAPHAAAAARA